MALLVYVTDECWEDAKKHSFVNEVTKFRDRILREQRVTLFDNFPPPFLKKRFIRQLRLVAADRRVGDHIVVCFYRLLIRSGPEYGSFYKAPKTYGERNFTPLVSDDILQKWVEDELQQEPPPEKQKPSEQEARYLWGVMAVPSMSGKDMFVCEAREWVTSVGQKPISDLLHWFLDPLFSLVDNASDTMNVTSVPRSGGWSILSRWIPSQNKLFLVAPVRNDTPEVIEKLREQYKDLLEGDSTLITDELIMRNSVRAYPVELLTDETTWRTAQQDDAANLALSPEEATVLESVHKMESSDGPVGFPLFINGRAGSGKSTILQYLYSDYLQHHLSEPHAGNAPGPLYLTCSSQLLDRCRRVVASILECSSRHADKTRDLDDVVKKKILSATSECFQEFHSFMTSLLPTPVRTSKFHPNAYVDYPRFKELWQDKYGNDQKAKKQFPPDLCWHVIRTYIKGLSVDDYIDDEEYEVLPKDEKSVSTEVFKRIYDRVWMSWYKPQIDEELAWDDQDLVRYVLAHGLLPAKYPAIFADESQDFTRLELEALFRLCVFSERKLSPQELGRVPFAFAGDPFQTLNPTGFRWDAIKSAFVVKFVKALDPARLAQMHDLNYRELDFNYRSSVNIVKLCNAVQALRLVLFEISGLKPQSTWQQEDSSPMPVWYVPGDPDLMKNLKDQGDITIIVPCDEGEEAEYVQKDSFLRSVVQIDEDGTPQNVLSSMRSKGLEFNRVVMYGFGSHGCPERLLEGVNGELQVNREELLTWEYFVNKLYVACSRARRRLYIIDNEEGLERLWRLCTDTDLQDKLIGRIKNRQDAWRQSIGVLQRGTNESWSSEGDNLEQLADRYEEDGRGKRDAYLLRQAALAFHAIDKEQRAKMCKALALRYERRYKDSGVLYAEIGANEQALQSFWAGKEYGALCDLCSKARVLGTKLESRFADFFARQSTVPAGAKVLGEFADGLNDDVFRASKVNDGLWLEAVAKAVDEVASRVPAKVFAAEWTSIAASVNAITAAGIRLQVSSLAKLAYATDDLSRAVSLWRETGDVNTALFRDAVQRISVKAVHEGRSAQLSPEERSLAINGLLAEGSYDLARELCELINDSEGIARILAAVGAKLDVADIQKYLASFIKALWVKATWPDIVGFAREHAFANAGEGVQGGLKKIMTNDPWVIHTMFVGACATSESLIDADNQTVNRHVSDYLKKLFLEGSDTWVSKVSPDVAGAALERSGRDKDCLQFYERIYKDSTFSDAQRKRARIRWVKCKYKQAEREEAEGKNRKRARDHKDEAAKRMAEWKVTKQDIESLYPDPSPYVGEIIKAKPPVAVTTDEKTPAVVVMPPVVPPVISANAPTKPSATGANIAFSLGSVKGDFYADDGGRLNLSLGSETVALRIAKKKCVSADLDIQQREDGLFVCDEWRIELDMRDIANSGALKVVHSDTRVIVLIPVTGPSST